jgi:hypothetical protein
MPDEKQLPSKQKAAVFHEYGGELTVLEIPIPEIGDDDLLIKVLYTGVCHTDVVSAFIDSRINNPSFSMSGKAIYRSKERRCRSLEDTKESEKLCEWART